MRIPEEIVAQIKDTAQITEVVSDFVVLKRRGQNYLGLCPFHNEKTPSFTVTPNKNFFKCFGCGKGGDATTFVMEIEGIGYLEALKYLAHKYHISIPEENQTDQYTEAQKSKESLYIVLNFAKRYFQEILERNPHGVAIAKPYFKERGIMPTSIAKFELGYSLEEWDNLLKTALKQNFSTDILDKAGLLIRKSEENKVYDRFRGRIMFPIHSITGRVIGFGARTLRKDEKPKYLNSPETEVYNKSEVLYGIFQAKNAIRQKDACYLVEGYTDVIAMHQAGVENVVASSGTSLTENQIKLIKRFTSNVTVLYDGDNAGIAASLRGIDLLLENGLDVRCVRLPEGEDPDSFIRHHGSLAFEEFLSVKVEDFISFKIKVLLHHNPHDPFERAKVISEVVHSISLIPDAIKRGIFYAQSSHLLGVSEQTIITAANKKRQQNPIAKPNTPKIDVFPMDFIEPAQDIPLELPSDFVPHEETISPPATQKKISPYTHAQEEQMIRFLVRYGNESMGEDGFCVADYILSELEEFTFQEETYNEIIEIYKAERLHGHRVDALALSEHYTGNVRNVLLRFIQDFYQTDEKLSITITQGEKDNIHNILYFNVLRYKERFLKQLSNQLTEKMKTASSSVELMETIKTHREIQEELKQIAKLIGIVTPNYRI